jgi:hypothetical protein
MKLFRSNIRRVSHIALFALAIQFALSFGHFHRIATQAAPSIQSAQQLPAPGHDPDQHPDDVCAICAVMAMANAVLLTTPPVVLQPYPIDFSYVTAAAEFDRVASVRAAFQPRAPPIS